MKNILKNSLTLFWVSIAFLGFSQEKEGIEFPNTLIIKKGNKFVFDRPDSDSTLYLKLDTLILEDKASLEFYGYKDVTLDIGHSIIGKRALIKGSFKENHAAHISLKTRFDKLESLHILAAGQDANNGFRTHDNGNGGNVEVHYSFAGIEPQTTKKRQKHFLDIQNQGGGKFINPTVEVGRVLSNIHSTNGRIVGLPQGQVYSGSPGKDGKTIIKGF